MNYKNNKKREHFKITVMSLLSLILVIITGCAKSLAPTVAENSNKTGMGRYVEKAIPSKEEIGRITGFTKQEDGSLLAFSYNYGVFRSKDEGTTWTKEDSWFDTMSQNYIMDAAINSKGEFACIYIPPSDTEVGIEEVEENKEAETKKETEEDDSFAQDSNSINAHYKYVDTNGQSMEIKALLPNKNSYLNRIALLPDGTLVGAESDSGMVCTIDKKSGNTEKLFLIDGYVNYLKVLGQYIIAITSDQLTIYDIQNGQLKETDQILADFIKQQKLDFSYTSSGNLSPIQIIEGDSKDTIYIACRDGVYRHVIGGSAMEQLIDGGLSTLGNPSVTIAAFYYRTDGSFLAYFSDNKRMQYVYDPKVAAVPEKELKVFSLRDNRTIRQAITGYQQKNPNVYVNYEVGISGSDAVTAEDAIKNLNTKLMTGNSPDILVLDGLSQDTYIEKGMLLDLSDEMKEVENQLFKNICHVYEKKDGLYAMPAKFQIPMVIGNKELVDKITDMDSLNEVAEHLRKENPEGTILGTYQPDELIRLLELVNAPNWVDKEGNMDAKALKEFLTKSSDIYEIEQSGITESQKQLHEKTKVNFADNNSLYMDASYTAFNYYTNMQALALGMTSSVQLDFSNITSVLEANKEADYALWRAGTDKVFIPGTIMSVTVKAKETQLALDFMKEALSKDTQSIDLSDGFPVNKDALKEIEKNPNEGIEIGMIASVDDTGREINLLINWPSEEQIKKLEDIIISLDKPNTIDAMYLSIVEEYAPKVWIGEMSVEEAVNEIINKIQIRMSE